MTDKIQLKECFVHCPMCGTQSHIVVFFNDYLAWEDGELAQNAFPYLSAANREILISGLCPHCQKEIFGGDEE